MPFLASIEASAGFGRAQPSQAAPPAPPAGDIKVAGNGAANLTTTGMTIATGVTGQDDSFQTIALPFDFYFFGTNYGNSLNSGFYWNTNNVLGFGPGNGLITWTATTGRGVLIGNADRRTNTFYYSGLLTSGDYSYINFVLFAQNIYNDGVPNAIQWQIRLFRSSTIQYIEVRASTRPNTGGQWNITNGTAFQGTFGSFTNVTAGSSFVLQSDGNGNGWTLYNNYRIPV